MDLLDGKGISFKLCAGRDAENNDDDDDSDGVAEDDYGDVDDDDYEEAVIDLAEGHTVRVEMTFPLVEQQPRCRRKLYIGESSEGVCEASDQKSPQRETAACFIEDQCPRHTIPERLVPASVMVVVILADVLMVVLASSVCSFVCTPIPFSGRWVNRGTEAAAAGMEEATAATAATQWKNWGCGGREEEGDTHALRFPYLPYPVWSSPVLSCLVHGSLARARTPPGWGRLVVLVSFVRISLASLSLPPPFPPFRIVPVEEPVEERAA